MNRANRTGKSSATGNTESGARKQEHQYSYWFFTWNNYPEQLEQIEHFYQLLVHECDWLVFQEEKGESGTKHLQGSIKLKKRQRLTQLKVLGNAIHWEPTINLKASIEYCNKEMTRNGRQWSYGIELPTPIIVDEPYGWQLEVVDIINNPANKRTIYWFWEPNGNMGKSTLCKWLVVKKNALIVSGRSSDIFHSIAENPAKRNLIVVDVPRSQQDFINYGAFEQIKNGLIFSGKYKSQQIVFNHPTLIVFANSEPDYNMMSHDRWVVRRIY